MHMSDALLSPAVGGIFWVASAGMIAHCAKKITDEQDERSVPLMGVTGAFVFAAQMINFAIPGTGSSGHIGGGLLLAILLGPHRAFLTLASVLTVQALLFADGGLLALGCNIFNLAFFPAFIAYPFIWKKIAGDSPGATRIALATVVAAVAGLEMGALCVVFQTILSGVSDLPFGVFSLFMLPIHVAIGVAEGFVTWGVVALVQRVQPSVLAPTAPSPRPRAALMVLTVLALLVGGFGSWYASSDPDGLEWSMGRSSGAEELSAPSRPLYAWLAGLQERTSLLPDYGFARPAGAADEGGSTNLGTSVSGIAGSMLVLVVAGLLGLLFRRRRRPESSKTSA